MRVDSSKNGFSPEGKLNFERIKYTTWRKLQRRALTFQKKFICFIESPFKMMKNAFYFILNALFVLKIFKFLSWLFGHVNKNGLMRKIRLISKSTRHNVSKQLQYTYCPIISGSKSNQAIKIGHLIDYNKRNIFLQKICGKSDSDTSSRPLFTF